MNDFRSHSTNELTQKITELQKSKHRSNYYRVTKK